MASFSRACASTASSVVVPPDKNIWSGYLKEWVNYSTWTYTTLDLYKSSASWRLQNTGDARIPSGSEWVSNKYYTIWVKAEDTADNIESPGTYASRISIDNAAPTCALQLPEHDKFYRTLPTMSGTVADLFAGIKNAKVRVQNVMNSKYWGGTSFNQSPANPDADGSWWRVAYSTTETKVANADWKLTEIVNAPGVDGITEDGTDGGQDDSLESGKKYIENGNMVQLAKFINFC